MTENNDHLKRVAMHETNAKWHVFYVQARHEKTAAKQLQDNAYEVYLPLKKTLKLWSQRKKWIEEPLFRSYIFIRVPEGKVHDVLQHPKILSYIRYNGRPATIRNDHLELIKKMLSSELPFDLTEKEPEVGQRMQFRTGPFQGHYGTIIEKRGKRKAIVKLDELDYQLVVDI